MTEIHVRAEQSRGRLQVGDDLLTAGAGELAFAPGGTPHVRR